jgi:hypothetical protein
MKGRGKLERRKKGVQVENDEEDQKEKKNEMVTKMKKD